MKKCAVCHEPKPLDEFHINRANKDGRHSYCKPCAVVKQREWRVNNPEKARGYELTKTTTDRHKHYVRRNGPWQLLNRCRFYGLTVEGYNERSQAQGGLCAICRRPETALYKGQPKNLHIDHDHNTGVTRGLLCSRCNTGLGSFKEDRGRLAAAIAYLDRWEVAEAAEATASAA